jgi:hypothetical protein
MVMSRLLAQSIAFVLFLAFAQGASAQGQPASTPASTSSDQLLKPEQLDALVSPIALYPDTLLAEVLMASTYPLEVVQASRWAAENKNLKGDALKTEVDKQGWDDSIKSLTATPDVLKMMSDKLDWTQKLGDAVLAQQTDVMDSIQRLRAKADANNKLQTTKQQKVTKKSDGGKQYIVIEPTDPQTVYVPYYDPAVVYGAWPYPAYPPYYWGAGYWPGRRSPPPAPGRSPPPGRRSPPPAPGRSPPPGRPSPPGRSACLPSWPRKSIRFCAPLRTLLPLLNLLATFWLL